VYVAARFIVLGVASVSLLNQVFCDKLCYAFIVESCPYL